MAWLAACLLLAACGSKGSGSGEVAAPSDPDMVTMGGAGISIGGTRVGDLPADALAIVEPLQNKLKERRESWTKEHPGKTFPEALTVELGPDVTCRQALSVVGTARTSGYYAIVFRHEATTLALPIRTQEKETEGGREKNVTIELRGDGNAWFTPEQCGGAFDIVPAASLPGTVQEWCGARGDCLREVGFTCDAGMPVAKVLPVINAVMSGSRLATFRASGSCDSPPTSPPDPPPWADRSDPPPVPVARPRNPEEALKVAISMAVRGDPSYAPPPPNAGEARPAATLGEAEVTATGALTAEEAREALKPVLAHITACYEAGLERDHLLDGRVVGTLEVGKKGAVMWGTSTGSDMPDPPVLRCASRVLASVAFPSKGAVAKVGYSVAMAPGPVPCELRPATCKPRSLTSKSQKLSWRFGANESNHVFTLWGG